MEGDFDLPFAVGVEAFSVALAFLRASRRLAFLVFALPSKVSSFSSCTDIAPGTPLFPLVFHASAVRFLYTSTSSGGL